MRRVAPLVPVLVMLLAWGAPASAAGPPDVVRVATAGDDNAAPLLYADKAGLFKKANLDVQITKMKSGAAIAAAVAGGSLDIGKSSLTGLIAAHLRGIDFTFVGKTISAAALNDINVVATQAWLEENGVDSKSVKFVEIPESAVSAALAQKRVDGSTVLNPVLADLINGGKNRVAATVFDGIANRFMISGWFASAAYVAQHRDVVDRFERVMQQAEAYANTHHAETLDLVVQFTGLDASTVAGMTRPTYPALLDPHDIQPLIDAEVKYKVIDKTFPATELISPTALRASK
jgi:NitT/TauT family transport system substrate-binding protein